MNWVERILDWDEVKVGMIIKYEWMNNDCDLCYRVLKVEEAGIAIRGLDIYDDNHRCVFIRAQYVDTDKITLVKE